MTIAVIIRTVLFILAGIALLMALRSLLAGMRSRSAVNKQYFNVGRLEAQRKVFANMLSTVGLVILALILGISAANIPDDLFGSGPVENVTEEASEMESQAASPEVVGQAAVDESETGVMAEPAPAGEEETAEPEIVVEPTAIPTETPVPTPEFPTVYVNSPIVGLYIRDLPEGDIIDVLDDQTPLSLLDSSEILNGINWIQVMTDDGREGWVAEQFTTSTPPQVLPLGDTTETEG